MIKGNGLVLEELFPNYWQVKKLRFKDCIEK